MSIQTTNFNSYRAILRLAIPAIMGFVGILIFETIDIYWIGKLTPKAVAAVASAAFIEWTIFTFMNITRTGCATLLSQAIGAGDCARAHQIIKESIQSSLLISLLIMLFLFPCTPTFFRWMGLDAETQIYAWQYFKVIVLALPFFYLFFLTADVLNSYGDTKTTMKILWLAILLNIILAPLLVFGYAGFPQLGITGASIATALSQILGTALRFYVLNRKKMIGPWRDFFHLSGKFTMPIFNIGLPSALTNSVWCLVFPGLTVIITKFGMMPLAGLNVGNRVEAIGYYFGLGMATAVATLVGQSIGRKDLKAATGIVAKGIVIITLMCIPTSLLYFFFSEELTGLINSNPDIIHHGSTYLKIVGGLGIFLGLEMVFEGAFNGLGNTKPYMWIRVPVTLARIPLAYVLAFHSSLAVSGIWWAIAITTVIKGTWLMYIFMTNTKNMILLGADRLHWKNLLLETRPSSYQN